MAGFNVAGRSQFQCGSLNITSGAIVGATGVLDMADATYPATAYQYGSAVEPVAASDYIKVNDAGMYKVQARVHGIGANGKYNRVAIYQNGAAMTQICTQQITALTGFTETVFNLERIVYANPGDYFTLYLTKESGGTFTIVEVDFEIVKVG